MHQEDALLGRIALHYKLVSQEQLTQASQRAVQGAGAGLGQALLELGVITAEQHRWLLDAAKQYLARQAGSASASGEGAAKVASAPVASAPVAAAPARSRALAEPLGGQGTLSGGTGAPLATGSVGNEDPARTGGFAASKNQGMSDFSGVVAQSMRSRLPSLAQILAKAVEAKASDVHIHAGAPLTMRLAGSLRELKTGVLDASSVEFILKDALGEDDRRFLNENLDFDTALVLPRVGRFRASFYRQQRGWDAVFRPIAPEPPSLEQLNMPPVLKRVTDFHQGLVLVTGPAGSGKSSTMAALVALLNEARSDHIITVEDPIEFIHTPKACVVNQRQAGRHTRSFANALRAALREDPDVIVIGELRDLETIQLAITAAETGHLVLGTLHTNNAIRTINRVLDVFPPKQQSQIRSMVSESLRAIVCQRLVPAIDGARRLPALEVLFVKPSVSNLIREEKTFQIRSVMQVGRAEGMTLLDDSLFDLVKSGQVAKDVARRYAEDPKRFA